MSWEDRKLISSTIPGGFNFTKDSFIDTCCYFFTTKQGRLYSLFNYVERLYATSKWKFDLQADNREGKHFMTFSVDS